MKKFFIRASIVLLTIITTVHADNSPSVLKRYSSKMTNNLIQGFLEGMTAGSIIAATKYYILPLLPIENPLNLSTETLSGMATTFLAMLVGAHCTDRYTNKKSCTEETSKFVGMIVGACAADLLRNTLINHEHHAIYKVSAVISDTTGSALQTLS